MRSINPALKFLGLLAVTLILAFHYDPVLNFLVFAFCMIAILASGVRPRTIGLLMLPILLAAVGMFVTGYRYTADNVMPISSTFFSLEDSHLYNGLAQGSRVLAYAGAGFLFTLTTDRVQLVRSFQRQFHVPVVFAYGLLAAWGIVPQMTREYRRTRAGFHARGLRVFPVSPALLKPLLVKSIRWSEELSVAMESKGFSSDEPRTEYQPIRVHARDWVFLVLCIILPLIVESIAKA